MTEIQQNPMKEELIKQLRMLGMGRLNAAHVIADILLPEATVTECSPIAVESAPIVDGHKAKRKYTRKLT